MLRSISILDRLCLEEKEQCILDTRPVKMILGSVAAEMGLLYGVGDDLCGFFAILIVSMLSITV